MFKKINEIRKSKKFKSFVSFGLMLSKLMTFASLTITAGIMYWIGSKEIAGMILVVICFGIIFNQLDQLSK